MSVALLIREVDARSLTFGSMYVPAETENIHQDLIHAIIRYNLCQSHLHQSYRTNTLSRKPFDTLSTVDVAWAFNQ